MIVAQPCGQDGPLYQVVLFHLKSARTHWLLASATPFKQTQHATLVSSALQNIFSESHVDILSYRKGPIDYKLN